MKKVDKKYGPKSRRIYKKFIKCGEKECSKENKLFKNYREILKTK